MDSARYLDDLSKCVRCGSCKAFCPTYDEVSEEGMGARGRLAILQGLASGAIASSAGLRARIFSCTLCGACSGMCPPGVDIPEVILHGRTILKGDDKERRLTRRLVALAVNKPVFSFRLLGFMQHFLRPYLMKKRIVPPDFELPARSLRDNVKVVSVRNKKGRVALFTGCMINFVYPGLGDSLINVLHALGYEIILPASEVCCGAPLRGLGLEKEARELARKNARLFNGLNVEAVLSLCPTCILTIKRDYPRLVGEGVLKAQDISAFLIDKLALPVLSGDSHPARKALYHDPCHLKYGLSIEKEPRRIISDMGIKLTGPAGGRCCGFAGVFCLTFMELSGRLLAACAEEYARADADMIITSCPGCILQLSRVPTGKTVVHLIEVIEEAVMANVPPDKPGSRQRYAATRM